jgi:RecB family exonuclease
MALDFEKPVHQNMLGRFIYKEDWLEFLFENMDNIALFDFAKESQNDLDYMSKLIPQYSDRHAQLKRAYDKKYYWDKCPRGSYYPFLLRVCSGFRQVWKECK